MGFDEDLRALIYRQFGDTTYAATVAECAAALSVSVGDVEAGLERLADSRAIVLRPDSHEVWMAHPFSGVDTAFRVSAGEKSWFANCAWDGFAILSLVGDGLFETEDPVTGVAARWTVRDGRITPDGVVHFAVPARHFWDDIEFT